MAKEKIVVIVGPTAVGKTALSIQLAQDFHGEVINGDSMQVYKDLDIATAKIKPEEMQGIPHHLLDILPVTEPYSASDFQEQASQKIREISNRQHLPLIVGGTGLYIESLLYDVSHGGESPKNTEYRQRLKELASQKPDRYLWQALHERDPLAAENIHPNNQQRLIRALEVIHQTGQPFSSFQQERNERESHYAAFVIGLNTDRQVLYDRINERVDQMMAEGLLAEAQALYEQYGEEVPGAKGIGYKELFPYFRGEMSLDQALEDLKQASRRYAKRQLTWFRNRTPVDVWLDLVQHPEDLSKLQQHLHCFLKKER